MKISWLDPLEWVPQELRQQAEAGNEVEELQQRWEQLQAAIPDENDRRRAALALLDEMNRTTAAADAASVSGALTEAVSPGSTLSRLTLSADEIGDRILGGWLGRAAGCLLGKPVEKHPRPVIRRLLESNGTWPLTDFITARGMPPELLQQYPWNRHYGRESLKENLDCMPEDDDMNYALLNLHVLETFGADFTTEQIAESWLSLLPVLTTFTAERVAYLNLLNGVRPPATATHRNPYREWIGAQIRADVWGWAAAGRPALAAQLAWRDGRLSHVNNGLYGEMFSAAAIAAAFTCTTPRAIIAQALQQIPATSRLAHAIAFAAELAQQEDDWEKVVDRLYEKFGHYHWVHTVNNAALVVAALLHGQGDYQRSICSVVMAGWDTDSNGATVGSILGTLLGASSLPQKWIGPLRNRLRSSMRGCDHSAFDDLARRTHAQILR